MVIAQLQWKPLDKLYLLWTICLIAHRKERNLSCSKAAITREYGEDIYFIFDTYHTLAYEHKLIDDMQLTARGNLAVKDWQRISNHIISLPLAPAY